MLVGYSVGIRDSKSRMFDHDSELRKCPLCGYRTDFMAHNPYYRLAQNHYDLCSTYDGQTIASLAFKQFCDREKYSGVRFSEFSDDAQHFHLVVERIVPFDAIRRKTRFENLCAECGNHESVIGATPAYLRVSAPLDRGIYRSDLLFASGNEKHPIMLIDSMTKAKFEAAGLRGIYFRPAEGLR